MADHVEDTDPETFEPSAEPSRRGLLRAVWRHKSLVALGVVAGAVIGAFYYARAIPIYQSSAQVLVVNKTADSRRLQGTESGASYQEDYLSTHQTLIRSPAIVGAAVTRADLGSLKSFAGRSDVTAEIIDGLKVNRKMNGSSATSILEISFRCPGREDAPKVIKAVIASYQEYLSRQYKNVSEKVADDIKQASKLLNQELTKKRDDYDKFNREHPLLWKDKDGISTTQAWVLKIEASRSALRLQETEIQGRLEAIQQAVKDGRHSQAELLAMIAQTSARPKDERAVVPSAIEEKLVTLMAEEKTLLEEHGKDHPKVQAVRTQMAILRHELRRLGKGLPDDKAQTLDPVQSYIHGLELELRNTRQAADALARLAKEAEQDALKLRADEQKDRAYSKDLARGEQLFETISKRLGEVNILKGFTGGYEADTIAPPGLGSKVAPKAVAVFIVAGFLGLLAGIGLAYLAEISDHSFRTPEEVRQRLGLPVVGHIPYFRPKADAVQPVGPDGVRLDPALCTVHLPKSGEAESYRGVRTAVYFNSRSQGHKVIQVTSPDMGDGKTTLAANLAVSIAQSGKKAILIDADCRRPRIHKLFGVTAGRGLASVIAGEAELGEAIQPSAVPGLSVLPCGPIPPNPAELLTLPRLREVVGAIREQYDFVVIDTPPLLAVTDPCAVVPCVDGVLLTLRIGKNARPHALRAKEILANLGASVVGVVINGVAQNVKGYSYTYKSSSYYSGDPHEADPAAPAGGAAVNGHGKAGPPSAHPSRLGERRGLLSWLFDR
jgi:capsular exopolysaccharide synthesis family protein